MIGIIDYGMGNLRSVQKAFEHKGAEAVILSDPAQLADVGRLVLPGVGAFGDGMTHLIQRGWVDPIRRFIELGKPFLGICLGMQLLFESSQEDASDSGWVAGLSIIPGRVVRFGPNGAEAEDGLGGSSKAAAMPKANSGRGRLKVPHMGWNTLDWRRDDPLLRGLEPGCAVYFVHSYYVPPAAQPSRSEKKHDAHDVSILSAVADYGGLFCASLWRDNIWATQFHPEKSQKVGLRMLANFAALG